MKRSTTTMALVLGVAAMVAGCFEDEAAVLDEAIALPAPSPSAPVDASPIDVTPDAGTTSGVVMVSSSTCSQPTRSPAHRASSR